MCHLKYTISYQHTKVSKLTINLQIDFRKKTCPQKFIFHRLRREVDLKIST